MESEKNTCEVFTYLRKVFLEDAVYLYDKYPDWPVYRDHPVFKDPLWLVYKASETERVASRHNKFLADIPMGQLSHQGLRSLKKLSKKNKTVELAQPTFTEDDIQAAVDAMQTDEFADMPFVLEPTDILAGYTQYLDIWKQQPRLNWKEWFGPNANVNSTRYSKIVDMYKYIDILVADETGGMKLDSISRALVSIAADLKVTQSCLVKNIFYFYKHPPHSTAVHQPLYPPSHIEAAFATHGLQL